MENWSEPSQISAIVVEKINLLQATLVSTDAWIQLAIIMAIFVLARWLLRRCRRLSRETI